MSGKRRNGPQLPKGLYPPRPVDPTEVERFLREQPPLPVPRRSWLTSVPGLVALPMLGYRVIRHLD